MHELIDLKTRIINQCYFCYAGKFYDQYLDSQIKRKQIHTISICGQ